MRFSLFQCAPERCKERSDVKPEVPIDLRQLLFDVAKRLRVDVHATTSFMQEVPTKSVALSWLVL